MKLRRGLVAGVACGMATLLGSGSATAINGSRPRTPPTFYDAACITTVDRSRVASVDVPYTIPLRDDALSDDELPDSRRLQFFAFARDLPPLQTLPAWVDAADVERARDAGIVAEDTAPTAAQILGTSPWADDAQALTTADDRRPITCEATREGVDWTLDTAPLGNYRVWAYTFEPPDSLWTPRPGLIRIVEGDDSAGPAVSLTSPARRTDVFATTGARIRGCLAAAPGTTVDFAWARASALQEWTTFASVVPSEDTFEIPFVPPDETVYDALYVRATATDPQGRSWVAYAPGELVPFPECPADAGAPRPIVLADHCQLIAEPSRTEPSAAAPCDDTEVETDTDADTDLGPVETGGGGTGSEGTSGPDSDGPSEASCACRSDRHSHPRPPMVVGAMLLGVMLGRRRGLDDSRLATDRGT